MFIKNKTFKIRTINFFSKMFNYKFFYLNLNLAVLKKITLWYKWF